MSAPSEKIFDNETVSVVRLDLSGHDRPDAVVWTLRTDAMMYDRTERGLHNAIRALEEVKAGIDEAIDFLRDELTGVQE